MVGPPPGSSDIVRLWIYCISGVATVIFLMIMVCYYAFHQEWSDRAARRQATENQRSRLLQWKEQVNSFPNLSHRPASDILAELNIGQHKP
ncbi:unnamed protein product [Adineta steineri]|uniref:Uncharacterized protein n=1 Tax=Adineta steineri TaxID=433720 RepID=A0A814XKY0_9BILA|nr:unnamed protein product [Adineta steineri]CAF1217511.1 unnamed protein product [Adineta steineri]